MSKVILIFKSFDYDTEETTYHTYYIKGTEEENDIDIDNIPDYFLFIKCYYINMLLITDISYIDNKVDLCFNTSHIELTLDDEQQTALKSKIREYNLSRIVNEN